jgi:alpha-L-arabinofuranosidase
MKISMSDRHSEVHYLKLWGMQAAGCVMVWMVCITGAACAAESIASNANCEVVIHVDKGKETISRHIYGQFIEHMGRCIYDGIWVGKDSTIPNVRGIRTDIVEALRKIKCPNIRWPGGCFADFYHWKDGIGPQSERPVRENIVWAIMETNQFGTHEFMDLCEQVGCEPYIVGNMGSGTVLEMQEWVEYLTSDKVTPITEMRRRNGREKPWEVRYFGIGNESWWCGGNMRPEDMAANYRRYQGYVGYNSGRKFFKIACGPNGDWDTPTEVMMRSAYQDELHVGVEMQGLALHWYCHTDKNRSATDFGEKEWFEVIQSARYTGSIIAKHKIIMDKYDPEKKTKLIVDEWGSGIWTNTDSHWSSSQNQNTLRDALVAGITLNVFNRNCDRVHMANLAQMVNACDELFITEGAGLILTPTYHVFDMYQVHHDATLLPTDVRCPDSNFLGTNPKFNPAWGGTIPMIDVSASRDKNGRIHVSLCNTQPRDPAFILCKLTGYTPSTVTGRVLTAPAINTYNTLEQPKAVSPTVFKEVRLQQDTVTATLPPRSVVVLEIN